MSDLVAIVPWALLVGIALWPPRSGGRAGFLVFVLSMTINELPSLFLALVTAGIVNSLIKGAAGELWSVTSMAWALIVAGMLWLQIRARSARPALEAALASALGDCWRATIRPELATHLSTRTPWPAGILLPFQRRHSKVESVRNLTYGPDPRAHRLDLYRNPASPAGRPILIHFEGDIGNKTGVGLVFDLGEVRQVSRVELNLDGNGTSLEVRVPAAEGAISAPLSSVDQWRSIGTANRTPAATSIPLDEPVHTRYVLVYLTELPPAGGQFTGGIAEARFWG